MTFPALIVVDRERFTMRLVRPAQDGLKSRTFPVAIGMVGYATRKGEYTVRSKSTTPAWLAPAWAEGFDENGEPIAGRVIPFDAPTNPFAGGFIGFEDDDPNNNNEGQGFHGTKFDPRLGSRASHGCVRMAVPDFESIYEQVPIGTLVVVY